MIFLEADLHGPDENLHTGIQACLPRELDNSRW